MCIDAESKKNVWKEHYDRLLNIEFQWDAENLSTPDSVEGPLSNINEETINKAILKMKSGKAAGPSGIVGEIILAPVQGLLQI